MLLAASGGSSWPCSPSRRQGGSPDGTLSDHIMKTRTEFAKLSAKDQMGYILAGGTLREDPPAPKPAQSKVSASHSVPGKPFAGDVRTRTWFDSLPTRGQADFIRGGGTVQN